MRDFDDAVAFVNDYLKQLTKLIVDIRNYLL